MSRCKLEEFISYEQPTKYIVDSDQYDDSYEIPVLTAGKSFILGYTDEKNNIFDDLPVIIFDDFTTSVQFVDFPFKVKSSAMKLLKNTEQADVKYCYYLLKFLQHTPENHKRQWLSATSQNTVELPTIEEQKNIVKKLDKILEVIDNQNKQLELLDEAIKARFVELFGNPLDGTAKYPIHQVGEVANSVDPQPSHRTPPVEEGGIPYVSIKDCDYKTGKIDFEGARKVSPKVLEEHMNRYTLHDGDFVVGKIGTIGNPVFVPARNDYTLSANVVLIQPNSELVSPYFLKYSFESDFVERQFAEAKNSTSQAAFGIQKVRTVEVMNPDLDVQREFEIFVKQVDKSKFLSNHSRFFLKSITF